MTPPFRTHATSLTDDELILLDVLFDCIATAGFLRRDGFSRVWNYHSHTLDDDQLRQTLHRFCEADILRTELSGGDLCYGLSAHGGRLWESERTPVWDRYAVDRHRDAAGGNWITSVIAVSPTICQEFWQVGCDMLWPIRRARGRVTRVTNHVLVPWKPFPAYVAVGVSGGTESGAYYDFPDWSLYESRRTWWGTVIELQKFVGRSP